MVARMHGIAFGGARFVNDPFKQAPDGGVGQRAGIVVLGVFEHFVFALGLVERNVLRVLELLDELLVDFIDAAAPVGEVHDDASRGGKKQIPRFARNDRILIGCRVGVKHPDMAGTGAALLQQQENGGLLHA